MSDRKLSSAKTKHALTSIVGSGGLQGSSLNLQMEVDKLALLLDQVKRQSDRVQEAADAMGLRLLPDPQIEAVREWVTTKRATVRCIGNV